jgi:hypothetical protein
LQQQYLHDFGTADLVTVRYKTASALLKERVSLVPEADISRAFVAAAPAPSIRPPASYVAVGGW